MKQVDRILREKVALEYNLRQLERLRIDERSGGEAVALVERAIENVRDAVESLERAVDESQA